MNATFTPTRQHDAGLRSYPAYHDRLEVAELAGWVRPRPEGFQEKDYLEAEALP